MLNSRKQYVFIEVRHSPTTSVVLTGPVTAVNVSGGNFDNSDVMCETSFLGNTIEVTLTAREGADKLTFMKGSLLEEVLRRGFKLSSNVTDDSLLLSREVSWLKEWFEWILVWFNSDSNDQI